MIRTVNLRTMLGILLVAALWLAPGPARAQNPEQVPPAPTLKKPQAPRPSTPAPTEPEEKINPIVVPVERVIVPVTVRDGKGHLINDLKKTDFEILEDGETQDIASFSTDPRALSAVILIDTEMSDRAERQLKETLPALRDSFSDFDEVALYTFSDRVDKLSDFGADRELAYRKLGRIVELSGNTAMVPGGPVFNGGPPSINGRPMNVGPPPNYSSLKPVGKRIVDAVFTAALALKSRPTDRRKVILVVSDGNNTDKNENSYADTVRLLLDNNIAVYGITADQIPVLNHVEITNVLPKFSADTGGDMFFSFKRETLENVYDSLTEQVRNQYELSYAPKRHTLDSVYKTIEVRVDRPDMKVTARQGYYAVSVANLTPPPGK
ncbi:MAG: VWA domain-containing protein [Acidobacteriia bacterium]|nr:VWA domain-containing protein [Terriglobia bacterium]